MQLSPFSRLEALITKESLEKLKHSTVMVVGIGGVGGYVCEALTRSAIGKIILVDFDVIDLTNMNRQIIATTKTIGRKKVDVMKERILEIAPECNVVTYDLFLDSDTMRQIDLENISYVVDCCDSVPTKKFLAKEMTRRGIPFLSSMGTANKMDPSLLEIVSIEKTFHDPLAKIMRKYAKEENLSFKVLSSRELPKKMGKILGSNAFVPPSAGLYLASYVVSEIIK